MSRWGQSQVSPLFKRRVDVRLPSRTEFVQIPGSDPHPPSAGRRPRANRQNVSPQLRRCSVNQAGFSCSRGIFSFASSSAGPCTSMRTSSARLSATSPPIEFPQIHACSMCNCSSRCDGLIPVGSPSVRSAEASTPTTSRAAASTSAAVARRRTLVTRKLPHSRHDRITAGGPRPCDAMRCA